MSAARSQFVGLRPSMGGSVILTQWGAEGLVRVLFLLVVRVSVVLVWGVGGRGSVIRLVRRGLLLIMARDEMMGRMMGRVKSDARSVGRRMVGWLVGWWLLWIE